jgi:putative transposase
MQSLGRRYVAHVNRRYGRTGTLWEGRYKSTILDSERYVLACHRYIEANPVRAGLAAAPQDYPWSSHCANAYGVFDPLLAEHETYRALGAGPGARQSAYRALFAQELDPRLLDELRDATQRGWVPGSAAFRGAIEAALGRPAGPRRRGRPPKPAADRDQRGGGSRPDARVPSDLGEK